MISVSDLRRKLFSETKSFSLYLETEIPSLNRDGMISVPNLRRKSFRLYLEMEMETKYFPSLIRDGKNPSLIRDGKFRFYFRLYIETE